MRIVKDIESATVTASLKQGGEFLITSGENRHVTRLVFFEIRGGRAYFFHEAVGYKEDFCYEVVRIKEGDVLRVGGSFIMEFNGPDQVVPITINEIKKIESVHG
jgi:hypothetical protein